MNELLEYAMPLSEVVIEQTGWILVHSLWQFTLVALAALTLMRFMRRRSAETRSAVLVCLLVISILFPIATLLLRQAIPEVAKTDSMDVVQLETQVSDVDSIVKDQAVVTPGSAIAATEQPIETSNLDRVSAIEVSDPVQADLIPFPAVSIVASTVSSLLDQVAAALHPWLASIVGAWVVGVTLCSLRPLTGWLTLLRLKRVGVSAASAKVLNSLANVSKRVGFQRTVQVLESSIAQVPLVVGYLKPVILLPASLLTNIPTTQLEAILAHELAHIRRHDFVINLLQVLVETLFFYHPAVWWLSRRIRVEREHCCDDMVVRVMGNRTEYGRALIAIEELRGRSSTLALGASDGSMLERIRRIAIHPGDCSSRNSRIGVSAFASFSLVLVLGGVTLFAGLISFPVKNEVAAMDDTETLPKTDTLPDGAITRFGSTRFRLPDPVEHLAISPDESFAVAGREYNTRVFDLKTGQVRFALPSGMETCAISPGGKEIFMKSREAIFVYDAETGKEIRKIDLGQFGAHESWYHPNHWLTFTPDGKAIVLTWRGKSIRFLDIESGETIREFSNDDDYREHGDSFKQVIAVAFTQDGRLMASCGFNRDDDGYFSRLWDVESGEELRRFDHGKQSHGTASIAFSPDTELLATRSYDGRLRLFDVEMGAELFEGEFPEDGRYRTLGAVTFSPDGKTVAVGGKSLVLYDVNTGKVQLKINHSYASHLRFTDEGKTLTAAVMGSIYRWDTTTGQPITPEAGNSPVAQVLTSPDGRRVYTRGSLGDVHIWDGATGELLKNLPDYTAWYQDISISPDGRYLAWPVKDEDITVEDPNNAGTTHDGRRIELYDIANGEMIKRFPGFAGDATHVYFTSKGKQLISVGQRDGLVCIWNFETGKEERRFVAAVDAEKTQLQQVMNAVLSPDGAKLIVAYHALDDSYVEEDGTRVQRMGFRVQPPRPTRIWDVETGKLLGETKIGVDMAFSPDSRLVISSDGAVWDMVTGKPVVNLPAKQTINAVAFSADGRFVGTGDRGGLIRVWEVATWTKRNEFDSDNEVTALTFTPTGLISGHQDTTAIVWDLHQAGAEPGTGRKD